MVPVGLRPPDRVAVSEICPPTSTGPDARVTREVATRSTVTSWVVDPRPASVTTASRAVPRTTAAAAVWTRGIRLASTAGSRCTSKSNRTVHSLPGPNDCNTSGAAGVNTTMPVASGGLTANGWSRHAPPVPIAVASSVNTPGSGLSHGADRSPHDGHRRMSVTVIGTIGNVG